MPPILDRSEDTETINRRSTYALYWGYFFLPFIWGLCAHTFCLDCIWLELSRQTGSIRYPLCRSLQYNFQSNKHIIAYIEFHYVCTTRSPQDQGIVKLQFLFLRLTVEENIISLNLRDPSNEVVFDPDLPPAQANQPGLPAFKVDQMVQTLIYPPTRRAKMGEGGCEDIYTEARINLLNCVPPHWLQGHLYSLRLREDTSQEALEERAPNYQRW